MSGGSFDYLCYNIDDDPLDSGVIDNIECMANWLAGKGKLEASAELTELRNYLVKVRQEIFARVGNRSLIEIMRAAEWWCSGDDGEDDFDTQYAKHKEAGNA